MLLDFVDNAIDMYPGELPSGVMGALLVLLRDAKSDWVKDIAGPLTALLLLMDFESVDIRVETYLSTRIRDNPPPPLPDDFYDKALAMIGTDISDEKVNAYFRAYVTSPGVDKDPVHASSPNADVKTPRHHLIVGRLLAANAYQSVKEYEFSRQRLDDMDLDVVENLRRLLLAFSLECKWRRTYDNYLHQIGRSVLFCEYLSLLNVTGHRSNPLKYMEEQMDPDAETALLSAPIDLPIADLAHSISSSNTIMDFITMTSLLQEAMDTPNLYILTGPHIPAHRRFNSPQLYIVSENFTCCPTGYGIVHKNRLITYETSSHKALYTLLQLIRMRWREPGYMDLLECCETPDTVSPTNPFARFVVASREPS